LESEFEFRHGEPFDEKLTDIVKDRLW
jgi:hypothetical protein